MSTLVSGAIGFLPGVVIPAQLTAVFLWCGNTKGYASRDRIEFAGVTKREEIRGNLGSGDRARSHQFPDAGRAACESRLARVRAGIRRKRSHIGHPF